MANTYTQIYTMFVFSVKGRQKLIIDKYEQEIHKYISSIVNAHSQKLICINGTNDHIHILISIKPNISISDLMKEVKASSSKWINEKKWFSSKFSWQKGYGAFSYSHSQLANVTEYIKNQKEHHKSVSFRQEYKKLLDSFKIDYNEKYIID